MQLRKLLSNRDMHIIFIDLLMLAILMVNLTLIVFDWLFISEMVQSLLQRYTPDFYQFYKVNIHHDFLTIDLYFVGIFLIELVIRWIISVRQHEYYRWFFYPFVHWYDVLGCIPVGTFRFLRILRVISIIIRMHKLRIIDITKSYLFSAATKYLNILVEEVSDRVVVNIIEGVQAEVRTGIPMTERIIREVILPHKPDLVNWISHKVVHISEEARRNYEKDLQGYLEEKVREAVRDNAEIHTISLIPVFGPLVKSNLESAISDIVYKVIDGMIADLASEANKMIIEDLTNLTVDTLMAEASEEDRKLNEVARQMVLDALELVKEQVQIQQWKLKEQQEKEHQASLQQRIAERLDGEAVDQ